MQSNINSNSINLNDVLDSKYMKRAIDCLQASLNELDSSLGSDADWIRVRRLFCRAWEICSTNRSFVLSALPYKEYLQTEHWKDKRSNALKAADYRCQVCNAGSCELHVHHRTYDRLGGERTGDVIVLCEPCHSLFHENRELATE